MEIVCEKCNRKLNIAGNKVPKDRVAYLKCPGCKNRITIGGSSPEKETKEEASSFTLEDLNSVTYDASEKPFDFIEEEGKTSLVCISDKETNAAVSADLCRADFHTTSADNARDALRKMRYHTFDLVVIEELFDCRNSSANGVLIFLQHLPMTARRNLFVILISNVHRTMDNMQAFNKSVNLIVNKKNIVDFKKILMRGIADHEAFYRAHKLAAKKILGI